MLFYGDKNSFLEDLPGLIFLLAQEVVPIIFIPYNGSLMGLLPNSIQISLDPVKHYTMSLLLTSIFQNLYN